MPDNTIPAAMIISIGVIASALMAWHYGDWKYCAFAGIVGTLFNLMCFFRRIAITARLLKQIRILKGAPPRPPREK